MADLLPHIQAVSFERPRGIMNSLRSRPPQVILLEGGTESQRFDMALYWAMLSNCPAVAKDGDVPCMDCPTCRQIANLEHLDLRILDGRISNKQDEEKPDKIRALRMENIRELKEALGAKPHGAGKRAIILQGMGITREEALNSLLKMLEEPSPDTLFVLLTPQRHQILPTLVSRSFCISLPWTDSGAVNADMRELDAELGEFFASGRGLLEKIAAKGAVDGVAAGQIILSCQRALARVLGRRQGRTNLDDALMPLRQNPGRAALVCQWLTEAQKMLENSVSPARLLESLCTRIFLLLRDS